MSIHPDDLAAVDTSISKLTEYLSRNDADAAQRGTAAVMDGILWHGWTEFASPDYPPVGFDDAFYHADWLSPLDRQRLLAVMTMGAEYLKHGERYAIELSNACREWLQHRGLLVAPPANLTDLQRDIWDLLFSTGHRLTTYEIFGGLPHRSEGMIKKELSVLRKRVILTNSKADDPPGYGLIEWDRRTKKESK